MKVVAVDNFDTELIDDILIKDNLTKEEADKIVKEHNDKMHEHSARYYRAVEDNYKLYKFEP